VEVLADHGAFNAAAQPTRYPAGFFSVFTGSYDLQAAHCSVTGVYTNKAPGGVAYSCSFRIAEAVYLVERIVDCVARELGIDPAELRLEEPPAPRAVPVREQDRLDLRLRRLRQHAAQGARVAGYDELRREQAEARSAAS
jgi:carbon-monoxide dehydrogenase large subunit